MKILNLLIASVLTLAGTVTSASGSAPIDGEVLLTVGAAGSGILRPSESLQLTGSVTNSAEQVVPAAVAKVFLPKITIDSADDLSNWLNQDSEAQLGSTESVASVQLGDLGTGQVHTFGLTIPAEATASISTTKVIPVVVEVATGTVAVASWKTVATVLPIDATERLSLSVITPISTKPEKNGLLSAEQLELLTASGGELEKELELASIHRLDLAIDPMVLASIRVLGDDAPDSAKVWLQRLSMLSNSSFALSYANADQGLVLQSGLDKPLEVLGFPVDQSQAANTTDSTPAPSETPTDPTPSGPTDWSYSIDSVGWFGNSALRTQDVEVLAKAGYRHLILQSSQVENSQAASALVKFDGVSNLDAVVLDESASSLIDRAARSSTLAERNDALSVLSARFAVAALAGTKSLVVALNRDDSGLGPRAEEVLDAVESSPFVTTDSLTSVLASTPASAELKSIEISAKRVSTGKALLRAEQSVTAFSTVVDSPELLNWPRRLSLLAMFSGSFSSDQEAWKAATTEFLADSNRILGSVHIPEGSTITLLQEKGNLPIAVANELSLPVTVYILAKPDRPILDVVENRVELKIEANSQAKASIPVQSIANGTVVTMLSLESGTGVHISTPTFVELNVQAGWETLATVILAIVVLLMFGAGIWRTVRKRIKSKRAEVAN